MEHGFDSRSRYEEEIDTKSISFLFIHHATFFLIYWRPIKDVFLPSRGQGRDNSICSAREYRGQGRDNTEDKTGASQASYNIKPKSVIKGYNCVYIAYPMN